MRGSDFADARAFVSVAEQGSFARAAGTLAVSPSALSQTIRGFEERLGVRLFNRTTRSTHLTDAGARLLLRMQPLLAEFDAALEEASGNRKPSGTLRVCAPQMAIIHLLQPMLGIFQEQYPDVVLDLTSDESLGDIVARGFDAGIRLGEHVDQDMVAVRVGPDLRQIAIASPDYLQKHGVPQSPQDLHEHRCINWRRTGQTSVYNWEFARDGQWFDLSVKGTLIVNDCAVALQAALDGLGITVWTEDWMKPQLESGRLVPLLRDWSPPFPGFFLYHPSRTRMPSALRAFIDVVKSVSMGADAAGPVLPSELLPSVQREPALAGSKVGA
ncbi:LysR family transcriptional regulator [Paraburkholderia sp. BL6669N2]|uniref:LysR family transcriptional regulator n=1 Tax=Paraburkholderia sp. BL6669N2 TaxID=1938807 RepID=UPI000E28192C|nr:LysR family transcriptional regulator [Paraburkholderia sp. BL6669N2]REG51042.1 LysR family transcriptional regulator [Paraburkholderia sp. BL6669N2]